MKASLLSLVGLAFANTVVQGRANFPPLHTCASTCPGECIKEACIWKPGWPYPGVEDPKQSCLEKCAPK
ncbi:BQ5605_C033g11195 [Microbotryum silenes-dioicae]|uniref:BQ5605_C033g11195 protein n=1 Tax=Microbotryum silenes-dioicae TaxID=796604 RepID=A0A2X0MKS8_9BASI|nr:BQ5605_C033g11195 [Microbotryum silenes-dioicae]